MSTVGKTVLMIFAGIVGRESDDTTRNFSSGVQLFGGVTETSVRSVELRRFSYTILFLFGIVLKKDST